MQEGRPLYLVLVCVNCVAVRHFKPKPKGNNIYYCPVCRFEVLWNNGVITSIGIPRTFTKTIEPPEESMEKIRKKIRDYYPEGLVRNPYGRTGRQSEG